MRSAVCGQTHVRTVVLRGSHYVDEPTCGVRPRRGYHFADEFAEADFTNTRTYVWCGLRIRAQCGWGLSSLVERVAVTCTAAHNLATRRHANSQFDPLH
ncbi:hypothetical protein EVAR_82812_1 [Eumeta japonica]|uniref:Uncharacterized protein n=1 Tax=Eumeta variegata TaxID=151549 RepID=A0A4C1UMU1_EUMVA|nr:hypothetical protein EVAR_82812_1 [Eumeta japonica]